MKYFILLSCLIPSLHAQTRNCQVECPIKYDTSATEMSYQSYQERQNCLSACEQSNSLQRQIQEQEEELRFQQEEMREQEQELESQKSTIKQMQEQIEDIDNELLTTP
ncbi:MAG: hypothetical protein WDA09_00125 [Bacteriovoracaceae bacterium]